MQLLRFLFGHGWWIAWHLGFWIILLLSVGLTLLIFGLELKPAGVQSDTPSPGSFMVVMIGLGLALVTLIDASILAGVRPWPWYGRVAMILGLPLLVGIVSFPLNFALATDQHRPIWWANVAVSAAVIVLNLWMLWRIESPTP
ncbi:MAG: hypothetical protein H0T11_09415 [Chthoniobacterales bacterium]|nr:hypothetical protein [Chthoniobacterales bacterium]